MIDFSKFSSDRLNSQPYAWAEVNELFDPDDAKILAQTFPRDHFKSVSGYGGEKDYDYEARALIPMDGQKISDATALSQSWLALAQDFLSPDYRHAISQLSGCDLNEAWLEVNVFHYGPRSLLGPHPDLPDKLVTHVVYFNETWNREDGGCLRILNSGNSSDIAAEIIPLVGSSALLVRSENSWHEVSPVVASCRQSRRSLTATFYRPGSVSTMWPPDDFTALHNYVEGTLPLETVPAKPATFGLWKRIISRGRS